MPTSKRVKATLIGAALGVVIGLTSAAYEVKPGDTLASIASEHGTTVTALVDTNDIANPNLIRIGQTLVIPGQGGPAAVTHTVALGETLGKIAAKYGVRVDRIVEVNGLRNPNVIRLGQTLIIPDVTGSGSASPGPGPTTTARPTTHVVQRGETLAGIALKYRISPDALAAANGITNANMIYSGATLVISDTAAPTVSGSRSTAAHTVAAGETLASIALRYGTTVSQLAEANGIGNPNLIRIGQTLDVPTSGWVCPLVGARYFNDWGFPRSGGRFHQGNDLFAPRGTEVRAPVSGNVELKTGTIGGLQFWMQGDDGNLYIGTHLDAFGKGGRVRAGDVIGYVGDSGNALGSSPHLHFEIHVAGSPTNPYPTLKQNGC